MPAYLYFKMVSNVTSNMFIEHPEWLVWNCVASDLGTISLIIGQTLFHCRFCTLCLLQYPRGLLNIKINMRVSATNKWDRKCHCVSPDGKYNITSKSLGVLFLSFVRRAMNSGTRITGQLRQPTTSLHTWPITWGIKGCLCLFKHHSPKHTPDW